MDASRRASVRSRGLTKLTGGWSMDEDDIDRLLAEFGLVLPEVEDERENDSLLPRGGWEELE